MVSKYLKFDCQLNFTLDVYISTIYRKENDTLIVQIMNNFEFLVEGFYRNC